jgi:hypothetical protein
MLTFPSRCRGDVVNSADDVIFRIALAADVVWVVAYLLVLYLLCSVDRGKCLYRQSVFSLPGQGQTRYLGCRYCGGVSLPYVAGARQSLDGTV